MKRFYLGIAMILGFVMLAGGGFATRAQGTPTASPVASPVASPEQLPTPRSASVTYTVTVNLTDRGFDPIYIQSTNGHDLTITLINTGTRTHAFNIDEFGIHQILGPRQQMVVVIRAPQELGDFRYYSDAPGDEGYQGEITFYI